MSERATLARYGAHADQWVAVREPAGRPRGTVALLHGGFWRSEHRADLMDGLAAALVGSGWVAANVEYRRLGDLTNGYPDLLLDVAAAIDALADMPAPLIAVGHSAGGQLALWSAARARLPAGAPGSRPLVPVTAAVAQAGVVDLAAGAHERLGRGAVELLMGGGPAERPGRYAAASPRALLPLGVPQLLVHGDRDESVPLGMSEDYAAAAAAAGDPVSLAVLPGAGHFEHLDAGSEAWRVASDWLDARATT